MRKKETKKQETKKQETKSKKPAQPAAAERVRSPSL
jgi:hypothetical protein